MNKPQPLRLIISGGGTGGHVFPAIAIADTVKKRMPEAEIHFVGAIGKFEMDKVPAAGYSITGLPIMGFPRRISTRIFAFFWYWMKSLWIARSILSTYKPHVVVGVGGYASAPMLQMASRKGIPYLIQEQNSYAGITNRSVARKAGSICVAYPGMERFFPRDRIVITGNPVRMDLLNATEKKSEALDFFSLNPEKKTILILGGSLGARTLNTCLINGLDVLKKENIQIIWQCGRLYQAEANAALNRSGAGNIRLYAFVERMDLAYAAADVIISRAGAGTISELCLVGKAVILVPSPNVAEDHQTRNALSLVERDAALMIKDAEALQELVPAMIQLSKDEAKQKQLAGQIASLALPNAADHIVDEIEKLIK